MKNSVSSYFDRCRPDEKIRRRHRPLLHPRTYHRILLHQILPAWSGRGRVLLPDESTKHLQAYFLPAVLTTDPSCLYIVLLIFPDSHPICRLKGIPLPHIGQISEGKDPETACTHISCPAGPDALSPSQDGIREQISLRRSQDVSHGQEPENTWLEYVHLHNGVLCTGCLPLSENRASGQDQPTSAALPE